MLVIYCSTVGAQVQTKFFRVNFNVNEHLLDKDDEAILDKLVKEIKTTQYAEILLTAHTDNDADDTYNLELSNKRALSVSAYLAQNGIDKSKVDISWFGERKPDASNKDDAGKSINRRVDILLKKYSFKAIGDLLKLAGEDYKQTYTINSGKASTIQGKGGTVFTIPAGALVTKNGQVINSANVKIELEEYLNPVDAIYNQLSTTCDGKLLESGGMFTIKANLNGEELQLKEGQKLDVQMPSANIKDGMQVFTGVKNAEGIMEWKATAKPFAVQNKNKVEYPFTKLNTKYLQSLMVTPVYVDKSTVQTVYVLPAVPVKPAKPRAPANMKEPEARNLFSWFENKVLPLSYRQRKTDADLLIRKSRYEKLLDAYNTKLDHYQTALAKYQLDSAKFEKEELAMFRIWINKQKEIHEDLIRAEHQKCFNYAVQKMIALSDSNKLKSVNPKGLFMSFTNPIYAQRFAMGRYQLVIERINSLEKLNMEAIVKVYGDHGEFHLETTEVLNHLGYYLYWRSNSFAEEVVRNDMELNAVFAKAQEDIIKKREALGLVDQTLVNNVYNASLSGFGVYNCDKFNSTPENQMAQIKIQYQGEARISFYVPKINSYIYAYRDGTGYHLSLPKNMEVKMVFVSFDESKGPLFLTEDRKFSGNETIIPQPLPVKLADIRKSLAML